MKDFATVSNPEMLRLKRSKSLPDSKGSPEEDKSSETPERHKFEMEHSDGSTTSKARSSSSAEIQHSLRQEISQLEKRLLEQVSVRCVLEKALGYKASSCDKITNDAEIPKPATELIREIAVLEREVGSLEQHLLSLYRKAFHQQTSVSPCKKNEVSRSPLTMPHRRRLDFSKSNVTSASECVPQPQLQPKPETQIQCQVNGPLVVDCGVQRSHSSLSQCAALANRTSPTAEEPLGKALRACRSQPLSMMEYAQKSTSCVMSLAELLGTRIPETPNKISEDMVKCMCKMYCKLADPPLMKNSLSSPVSSSTSTSAHSPEDLWSPGLRNDSSFDVRLDNSFHVEGLKDCSEPYNTVVEVNSIYSDCQKLGDVEYLLQIFRSLVSRLEGVNPGKMTHDEKLAFWINVHNALVMHAFLAYGIPQNNTKRMYLFLKAAYNIGGQIVTADAIQSSILGCRVHRPGQWLRLLIPSKTKFKPHDERQGYGIERPEPLLYFALSSGSHSDPAVRVYTPKMVYQELEAARQAYIRATFGVRKDHKILLPKIVDCYAKDSGLSHADTLEMVRQSLPEPQRKCVEKCQQPKNRKNVEWVSHNFAFRYIIMKDQVI